MTDLIQEIEKAINETAKKEFSPFFDRSSIDQNSSLRMAFKMGYQFILPLLKRVLSQRDEYILMRKRHVYTSKQFAADEQKIESYELNKELLKELGAE